MPKRIELDINRIVRLYLSGKSTPEIGRILRVSQCTVARRLKGHNIQLRDNGKLGTYVDKIISLYQNDMLSCREIADLFGVSTTAIFSQLQKNNIPRRGISEGRSLKNGVAMGADTYRNPDWLYYQYRTLKKSQTKIAEEIGVSQSVIGEWMRKQNIPRRDVAVSIKKCANHFEPNKTYRNKEWLIKQYTVKKKSGREIARECGVNTGVILKYIDRHKIKRCPTNGYKIKDLVGKRFCRLVAISPAKEKANDGQALWMCRCNCGNTVVVRSGDLSSGNTKSCGCLNKEMAARKGDKNPAWQSNKTDEERQRKRNYFEYREWRNAIFERDDYVCQKCGEYSGKLNAHHIESYDINKDLRTVLENGVTFCEDCHNDFHHIYGRGNNTREQFDEFMLLKDYKDAI